MLNRGWGFVLRSAGVLALLTGSTAALAENSTASGFSLSRFEPAERGSHFFTTESLDWRTDGAPTLGLITDYAYKPLVIYRLTESGQQELVPVAKNFAVGHLGGSLNIGERFRVGLDLPVVLYADGTSGQLGLVTYASPQRSGLGDLRVSGDWRFFGAASDSLRAGVGVRLFVPTGDTKAYASDGAFRGTVQVSIAGDVAKAFVYSARLGLQVRGREIAYAGGTIGSEAQLGLALGWQTLGGKLVVGPELSSSTAFRQAFSAESTAFDLMLGAHYDITSQWRVGLGAGRGATVGLGSPSFRGLLSVEWVPPTDDAACRQALVDKEAELRRLNEAAAQAESERAAAEAAARIAREKAEADRLAAEQLANDEAAARRKAAEHARADDDGDGIANGVDGCPSEVGFASDEAAKNGCPNGALVGDQLVLELVRFKTGSDVILPESEALLAKVKEAITKLPGHYHYRIEGHTDDTGPAAYNKDLSERRAKSVMRWMAAHGLEASRFEAAGFGQERPVVANDSDAHRQSNRRVEFHVTNLQVKP